MLTARAGQSLTRAVPLLNVTQQTRSVHLSGRILPSVKPTNLAHRARTFITRFITNLQVAPVSRSFHPSPTIRQSLSLPARIALSRPLRAPWLPRAPRIPGNVTQIGLGTARNFSTGRPIFQHIVENIPVTGRAFYEVDWDVKMRKEKEARVRRPKKTHRKAKSADKLRPRTEGGANVANTIVEQEDLDYYFSGPPISPTTTYLQIPLAPTPTARVPLSVEASPRLFPIPTLAKELASHSKHAIKVSSLFRRLDAARVWENGVSCEIFGDPSGLCTILKVKFEGWTEDMVRSILGDAGKDWCTLQEIREEESLVTSLASTPPRIFSPQPTPPVTSDGEGMSFVMPTFDLSASFSSPTVWPETSSSFASLSETDTNYSSLSAPQSVWEEDDMSVSSLETFNSANEWSSLASSPGSQSWLCFSSEFADKATF